MKQNDSMVQTRGSEMSSQHTSRSVVSDTNNVNNSLPDTFGVMIQTEVKLEIACESSGWRETHNFKVTQLTPNDKPLFKSKPKSRPKTIRNSEQSFGDGKKGNVDGDGIDGFAKRTLRFSDKMDKFNSLSGEGEDEHIFTQPDETKDELTKLSLSLTRGQQAPITSFDKDTQSSLLDSSSSISPNMRTHMHMQTTRSPDDVQALSKDRQDNVISSVIDNSAPLEPSDERNSCESSLVSKPVKPLESVESLTCAEPVESFGATPSPSHTSFKVVSFGPTEARFLPQDSHYSGVDRRTLLNEGVLYPVDTPSRVDLSSVVSEAVSPRDLSHTFLTGFFGAICVNAVLAVFTFGLWLSITLTVNLYFSREDKEKNFSLASCISLLILILLYLIYFAMFICTAGCIPCWQPSRRGSGKCCGFAFRGGYFVNDNLHRALRKDTISDSEALTIMHTMASAKPRIIISVGAYHYIRGDAEQDSVDHGERRRRKYTFCGERDVDVEDFVLASVHPEVFFEALRDMYSPTARFKAHLVLMEDQKRMIQQVMDVLRKLHEGQDVFVEVGAFYDPGFSMDEKKERVVIFSPTTQSSTPKSKMEYSHPLGLYNDSNNTQNEGENSIHRMSACEKEKVPEFVKNVGETVCDNKVVISSLLSRNVEEDRLHDDEQTGEVCIIPPSRIDPVNMVNTVEERDVYIDSMKERGVVDTSPHYHEYPKLREIEAVGNQYGQHGQHGQRGQGDGEGGTDGTDDTDNTDGTSGGIDRKDGKDGTNGTYEKHSSLDKTQHCRHTSRHTSRIRPTSHPNRTKHTRHIRHKKSTRSSSRSRDNHSITIHSSSTYSSLTRNMVSTATFMYSGFIHHPETIIFESQKRQHIVGRFLDSVLFNRICLWVAMYSTMYLVFVMLWRGSHHQIQFTCIKHVILTRKIHPMIPLPQKQYQAMYTS